MLAALDIYGSLFKIQKASKQVRSPAQNASLCASLFCFLLSAHLIIFISLGSWGNHASLHPREAPTGYPCSLSKVAIVIFIRENTG